MSLVPIWFILAIRSDVIANNAIIMKETSGSTARLAGSYRRP